MASVTLESIKRKFNNVIAIEDITFTIPDGEFWVLVGLRDAVNLLFYELLQV